MLAEVFTLFIAVTLAAEHNVTVDNILATTGPVSAMDGLATLYNITLNEFYLSRGMNLSYSPDELTIRSGLPTLTVFGDAQLDFLDDFQDFPFNITINGTADFLKDVKQNKFEKAEKCDFKLKANVNAEIASCDDIVKQINSTYTPPPVIACPAALPNTTPVGQSVLVRAAVNALAWLKKRMNIDVNLSTPCDTAMHVEVRARNTFATGSRWSFDDVYEALERSVAALRSFLPAQAWNDMTSQLSNITNGLSQAKVTNGPLVGAVELAANIPAGATLSFDLFFKGYQCDKTGYVCTFPVKDGIQMANFAITGMNDLDRITTLHSQIESLVNDQLNVTFAYMCDAEQGTCTVSAPNKVATRVPPVGLLVALPIACVVLSFFFAALNVWRHRRHPVLWLSGSPVSTLRIAGEDFLFCLFVTATFALFIYSNVTTAATVTIAGTLEMYSFSLMNTVHDLWSSGLKPLSFFVMLFSGVYPYLKLACMLLFTVILHRPTSRVLKVIDVIGKFSFLDTFVMIIMESGMEMEGIADVHILPSFFIFFFATVFSIAAGNYAVHLWRKGTSVRSVTVSTTTEKAVVKTDSTEDKVLDREPTHAGALKNVFPSPSMEISDSSVCSDDVVEKSWYLRFVHRVWWRVSLPVGAVVIGLTIPVFATTCLSFTVGGLGHVAIPEPRSFSLFSMCLKAHWICFVMVLICVLVAPILSALFFDPLTFLTSWAAADTFLLACVTALVQLNQFVQFVLGGEYSVVYSIHAHMHWPLILLLIAVIITWLLYVMDLVDARSKLRRWMSQRRTSHVAA